MKKQIAAIIIFILVGSLPSTTLTKTSKSSNHESYHIIAKDRKTGKEINGTYVFKKNNLNPSISAELILYYEDKFLSPGEIFRFSLSTKLKVGGTIGENWKLERNIYYKKFQKLRWKGFSLTEIQGIVEFGISSQKRSPSFTDFRSIMRIYDNKLEIFDLEIIDRTNIRKKQTSRYVVLAVLLVLFISVSFVGKIVSRTKEVGYYYLYYSDISTIFVALASLGVAIQFTYLTGVWITMIYTGFFGGIHLYFSLKVIKSGIGWRARDNSKNVVTRLWGWTNILGLIFTVIFPKLLPFFSFSILVGSFLDMALMEKNSEFNEKKVKNRIVYPLIGTLGQIIPICILGNEFYYSYSPSLHYVDSEFFPIWIILLLILVALVWFGILLNWPPKEDLKLCKSRTRVKKREESYPKPSIQPKIDIEMEIAKRERELLLKKKREEEERMKANLVNERMEYAKEEEDIMVNYEEEEIQKER